MGENPNIALIYPFSKSDTNVGRVFHEVKISRRPFLKYESKLAWKDVENINFDMFDERMCVLHKWIHLDEIKIEVMTHNSVFNCVEWM